MKRIFAFCIFLLLSLVAASSAAAQTNTHANDEPALPYIPSLDVTAMDRSVDPCVDLYHYSCGGWQKKNPIPPDQTSWWVYAKLYQDNLIFLRGILEQAGPSTPQRDAVTQKIGDFYAACMDETTPKSAAWRRFSRNWTRSLLSSPPTTWLRWSLACRFLLAARFCLPLAQPRIPTTPNRRLPISTRAAWDCPTAITTPRTTPNRKRFASATCSTCRRFSSCWATRPSRQAECRNGHAHGNRAGQGFLDPGGTPRSLQAEEQNEGGRSEPDGAELRLEDLLSRVQYPEFEILNVDAPPFISR